MGDYKQLTNCRISNSDHLVSVLNLGEQTLTGVFPQTMDEQITRGPLELVWCPDSGLLQLNHTYDTFEMYGENYGYRSGLNQSMVEHLGDKVHLLEQFVALESGDAVLDIGSNDATTLKAYQTKGLKKVGIDPTGAKFESFYADDIDLVPEFFSAALYQSAHSGLAKIITSIAMFYDLDNPIDFAQQIASILSDEGIWHFEQSYMPSMLRQNSYDTICHEHLEYYSLQTVEKILAQADLKIIDVKMNAVNGGSFAVTAAKSTNNSLPVNDAVINWLLEQEDRMGLDTPAPYGEFERRVFGHRDDLRQLIDSLNSDGKKILGYGASTKGNVVLQFCGFTDRDIPAIAEINPEKFGRYTPGTGIPIISEHEAAAMNPDYYLVLPWHFKDGIVRRERQHLARGGKMIIPFPEIEII